MIDPLYLLSSFIFKMGTILTKYCSDVGVVQGVPDAWVVLLE